MKLPLSHVQSRNSSGCRSAIDAAGGFFMCSTPVDALGNLHRANHHIAKLIFWQSINRIRRTKCRPDENFGPSEIAISRWVTFLLSALHWEIKKLKINMHNISCYILEIKKSSENFVLINNINKRFLRVCCISNKIKC